MESQKYFLGLTDLSSWPTALVRMGLFSVYFIIFFIVIILKQPLYVNHCYSCKGFSFNFFTFNLCLYFFILNSYKLRTYLYVK